MPLIAPAEAAAATRRRASFNGSGFWHSTFLGANRYRPDAVPPPVPGRPYAVAFLVEQDPDSTVAAHFHQADQFQVLTGGSGTLGTHAARPVTVHFAAAFSAYGPVRAGAAGLTYFTLRNGWDPGARTMPAARGDLPRPRRHRELVSQPLAPHGPASAAGTAVLAPAADGLGAWHYRLPAGAAPAGPDPAGGAGQYWLVLAGALDLGAARLGPRSCVFVGPEEMAPATRAGPQGASVLALQFPRAPERDAGAGNPVA